MIYAQLSGSPWLAGEGEGNEMPMLQLPHNLYSREMENDSVTITQMEARVKDDYESDNETFPFYQEGELDVILSSLDQELDLDLEMSTRRRPSATSDREAFKRPCIEPEGVSRQGESNTNGYELKYEPTEVSATLSHEPGEEFDESMAMDEDGMFVKFQMMADEITRRITEFDNGF